MAVCGRKVDGGKGEGVGHLKGGEGVHADEEAGCRGGEGLRAVLDHFHDNLVVCILSYLVRRLKEIVALCPTKAST